MYERDAEDCEYRVPDELLHNSAEALDDRPRTVIEEANDLRDLLGVEPIAALGRVDEVAEEHADDLPRLGCAVAIERPSAAHAEGRLSRVLLSAAGTPFRGCRLCHQRRLLRVSAKPQWGADNRTCGGGTAVETAAPCSGSMVRWTSLCSAAAATARRSGRQSVGAVHSRGSPSSVFTSSASFRAGLPVAARSPPSKTRRPWSGPSGTSTSSSRQPYSGRRGTLLAWRRSS